MAKNRSEQRSEEMPKAPVEPKAFESIVFAEAIELLTEVSLPINIEGVDFVQRTYTDLETGKRYNIVISDCAPATEDSIRAAELEQMLRPQAVFVIKYTASVVSWGIQYGIQIGQISALIAAQKPTLLPPN